MRLFLLNMFLLASFLGRGQAITFGKLGNGINNDGYYTPVRAMFYDTIDKKLYVGGQFIKADNKIVWGAAVWHNNSWDSLRGGLTNIPQQSPGANTQSQSWAWGITRFQNKIYFIGGIVWVNGHNQYHMGVWNGTNWDYPIAEPPNGPIFDMKVYNNTLYACGEFTKFGNTLCNYIAKFDGVSWQPVGDFTKFYKSYGPPTQITSLEVYNNELYVGGAFDDSTGTPRNIAKFDGTKWVNVSTGIAQGGINFVNCMKVFNNKLYIGGRFQKTSQIPGEALVYWNGVDYLGVNSEGIINGGQVNYLNTYKNEKLFVIGGFNNFSTPSIIGMFYVGTDNVPCGISGMDSTYNQLPPTFYNIERCTMIGDSLVVAGLFKKLDTVSANSIGFIRNYDNNPNCLYVGIKENDFAKESIKIFPNPANEELTILLNVSINTEINQILIYNSIGQLIREEEISFKNEQAKLNTTTLSSGVYYLKLNGINKRFVIAK